MSERAGGFETWWFENGMSPEYHNERDVNLTRHMTEEAWHDRDAEIAALQERIRELENLPVEWEGSGYSPQQCGRIVKAYWERVEELKVAQERIRSLEAALSPSRPFQEWWKSLSEMYGGEGFSPAYDAWHARDAELAALRERIRVLEAQVQRVTNSMVTITQGYGILGHPAAMPEPGARDEHFLERVRLEARIAERRIVLQELHSPYDDWNLRRWQTDEIETLTTKLAALAPSRSGHLAAMPEPSAREALVAAAYKAAAEIAEKLSDPLQLPETISNGITVSMTAKAIAEQILALTPADAQRELDRQLAEARLKEAKWWEHLAGDSCAWHFEIGEHPCPYCVHTAELEAALARRQPRSRSKK